VARTQRTTAKPAKGRNQGVAQRRGQGQTGGAPRRRASRSRSPGAQEQLELSWRRERRRSATSGEAQQLRSFATTTVTVNSSVEEDRTGPTIESKQSVSVCVQNVAPRAACTRIGRRQGTGALRSKKGAVLTAIHQAAAKTARGLLDWDVAECLCGSVALSSV